MIKWKSNHFKDLKPFDIVSLDNLLDRTKQTMLDIDETDFNDQWEEGRAFIKFSVDNQNDPEVKYWHQKYNSSKCPLPTKDQIILHQFKAPHSKPEFHTERNKNIFSNNTTNVNGRDGFINGGFSELDIWEHFINYKRRGIVTGEWIYLELNFKYILENMFTSVNRAPLHAAKQFINDVENIGWKNKEKVNLLIKEYDKKYPNWSHDFPIESFLDVKKNGILFPCQWWNPEMIAGNGTHRMIMTGFNKINTPYITQIPKNNPLKWYSQSRYPIFEYNGKPSYLVCSIDRLKEKVEYSFTNNTNFAIEKNKQRLI